MKRGWEGGFWFIDRGSIGPRDASKRPAALGRSCDVGIVVVAAALGQSVGALGQSVGALVAGSIPLAVGHGARVGLGVQRKLFIDFFVLNKRTKIK